MLRKFITIFAGLGLESGSAGDYVNSSFLVLGVFLGSAFFYFVLSSLIAIIGTKMKSNHLVLGNRLSGIIIGMLGVTTVASLIM